MENVCIHWRYCGNPSLSHGIENGLNQSIVLLKSKHVEVVPGYVGDRLAEGLEVGILAAFRRQPFKRLTITIEIVDEKSAPRLNGRFRELKELVPLDLRMGLPSLMSP